MADTPTRTDAPPPPPPRPPEQSLKPSPEFQQKLDSFRAQKEAKQDAGQMVDNRAGKAENQATRQSAEGQRAQQQRPPAEGQGRSAQPQDAASRRAENPAGGRQPDGLRPTPEFQQKLDSFRAQKEAKQDAGQMVDNRAAKAENAAGRNGGAAQQQSRDGVSRQPRAEGVQQPRAEGVQQPRAEGVQQPRAEGVQQPRAEGVQQPRAEGTPRPQRMEGTQPQPRAEGSVQQNRMENAAQPRMENAGQPRMENAAQQPRTEATSPQRVGDAAAQRAPEPPRSEAGVKPQERPSGAARQEVPNAAGRQETPSAPGRQEAPSGAGRQEGQNPAGSREGQNPAGSRENQNRAGQDTAGNRQAPPADGRGPGDRQPGPPGPPETGPGGHDRRVYQPKHMSADADLRGKPDAAERAAKEQSDVRPQGRHYREGDNTPQGQPSEVNTEAAAQQDSKDAQRQKIQDAVATAKAAGLENAVNDLHAQNAGTAPAAERGSPATDTSAARPAGESPVKNAPPEGPLITNAPPEGQQPVTEDPHLSPASKAMLINAGKAGGDQLGDALGVPGLGTGIEAGAAAWEAKTTGGWRNAAINQGFDSASGAVQDRAGIDHDPNIDTTVDKLKDQANNLLDNHLPRKSREDDGQGPLTSG